ncbi:hypothetical protein NL676_025144 [Syzygium grande]|nr:hypothetical protein NL676_025144 [Syzygium grande]
MQTKMTSLSSPRSSSLRLILCCFFLFLAAQPPQPPRAFAAAARWQLLQSNIGIVAMHMQLLHNDRVVIFDRTDFGKSNLSLPDGQCRHDPTETAVVDDCTAHSVDLVQTGGYSDGERQVRIFVPCSDGSCDWREIANGLGARRWYATNQILPDGRQIVIGGRRQFNYEFYPKSAGAPNVYSLPFLVETNDRGIENNLYPFVHLNVDGNLFIFANNRAILFDYVNNKPKCWSAAELPKGAFTQAMGGKFLGALNTCGRIRITDPNPQWAMETMPQARTMGDMVMLPNGDVLIINGVAAGTAGWEYGRNPVLKPVIYRPDAPAGSRFALQDPSGIPRAYHSTAVLLRDGRVLVGGSNPHIYYNFTGVIFPTELRLEAFRPPYLDPERSGSRPQIIFPSSQAKIRYSQSFVVRFTVSGNVSTDAVSVTMVAPPFTTHSFSMNQRLLVIGGGKVTNVGNSAFTADAVAPGSRNLAPAGYYMLFVVHQGVPSEGIWVQIQ